MIQYLKSTVQFLLLLCVAFGIVALAIEREDQRILDELLPPTPPHVTWYVVGGPDPTLDMYVIVTAGKVVALTLAKEVQ